MTTPIPSPPSLPFLGNLTALEKEVPQRSFELLADQYGEIYQLNLISRSPSSMHCANFALTPALTLNRRTSPRSSTSTSILRVGRRQTGRP